MLDLEAVRELIKPLYEDDSDKKIVETRGATLDEALADAAIQLNTSLKYLDFEILEKGSAGFLGLGTKNWTIKAYEIAKAKDKKKATEQVDLDDSLNKAEEIVERADGFACVHVASDGVYMKITVPVGDGVFATQKDAVQVLRERGVGDYDLNLVESMVKNPDGIYKRVADWKYNPSNDALMTVDIAENEMKAWIYVSPPGPGGADLSGDVISSFLRNNRVVAGVKEDAIQNFHDKPVYRENFLVAEGIEPYNGKDAHIVYNFETDQTKIRLKETETGKVDFKELNLIQNVVEGQPLAKKIIAERGIPGKTVTGRYLESKNGKDIQLPIGKNVKVAGDDVTLLAETNGQVLLIGNKVNVEPILNIPGDVSLRTGNIMFLGTVVVAGNVEDGFSVKASGNIEVHGTVGKAEIDAEGDVVVNQGITGRNEGRIRAGKSIWSRFIENANASAGEFVIVSDGIINSTVTSKRKILCQGKRATIVGGHLNAAEEIHAKTLGSAGGGSETLLEVGFDPEKKERLDEILTKRAEAEKELDEIELNLQTLINIKKQRKVLPEDKEASLQKLSERRQIIGLEMEEIDKEAESIQNYLNGLRTHGRISASSRVFAGVVVVIRDVKEQVRTDCKATTFALEGGIVRYGKYEGPDDDMKRVPDGYTSN